MATLKQGLTLQKKSTKPLKPAVGKPIGIFGDEEDEPESHIASEHKGDGRSQSKNGGKHISSSQVNDLSARQTHRKQLEEATSLDPSIYDYDAAFDAIHARDAVKKAAKKKEAEKREVKYMAQAMEAAEVRKRDQLRARDKVLQMEREAEGDDFADKAKFVTGAYKKQQEELQRLEEEEAKKEEVEARKKQGTGHFLYQNLMDVEEKRHQETAAAAVLASQSDDLTLAQESREKSQAEIAKEINAKGGHVIINEDGEVAVKTQLLTAGLNVVRKPNAMRTSQASSARSTVPQPAFQGRTATQKAMRERQSRLVEEQLEQATKRAADDEDEERRKVEHSAKSRKTGGEISSARERYLQRKKEAAAASNSHS